MTLQELDYWFPFIVAGYGLIMTFTLFHPKLVQLAEERLPYETLVAFKAKKGLALICLSVGSLWALQNIWLS